MKKVVVFRPTAERKHSIREAFPRAGEEEVAPDAPCLRDHPVSGVRTLREYDTVFQQPPREAFFQRISQLRFSGGWIIYRDVAGKVSVQGIGNKENGNGEAFLISVYERRKRRTWLD